MIKLKLNWFTNITNEADKLDTKKDNRVQFTANGITYNVDANVFNFGYGTNTGLGFGARQDAMTNVNFVKYYIESGGNIGSFLDFQSYLTSQGMNITGDVVTANNWGSYSGSVVEKIKTAIANGQFSTLDSAGVAQPITALSDVSGIAPGLTPVDAQGNAFNQYYKDVYSLEPGTGGAGMLSRLEQSYMNQAQQQATMADVQFQQAAMQQAQTVKQITDQVRTERLARLRSGMSESQIANQDMQMLMTNVNTLNQNAGMLNDQRLQAQLGMNTAQDQAYADFLGQANQRGQVASAMAAADAGDPYQQTVRRMTTLYGNDATKWLPRDFTREYNIAATGNPLGTSNK